MHDSLKDHLRDPRDTRHHFNGFPVITDQVTKEGVAVVWHALEATLQANIAGDVVEFGCYAGTTSVFIRRLLNQQGSDKVFHVYDSFDGLPEKSVQDANAAGVDFAAGKLYVSKADFVKVFRQAGLQPPIIHKGWFSQLAAGEASVGALADAVGLSQSALSQHLAKMREDEIVVTRREAQTMFYRIADRKVAKLLAVLKDIYCR